MKTYKLLNAMRYLDRRDARLLLDASLSENLIIANKALGTTGQSLVDKQTGKTLGSLLGNVIDATKGGIEKVKSFGEAMQTLLNAVSRVRKQKIPGSEQINAKVLNESLKEAAKQNKERVGINETTGTSLVTIYNKGERDQRLNTAKRSLRAKAYAENPLNKRSEIRSPSNVSMVGMPAHVEPSLTPQAVQKSVERWASKSAPGLKLGKNGRIYYLGEPINENNIPSSLKGLVKYYPSKEEAIKGIKNILRTRLEKRRISIANSYKHSQEEGAKRSSRYEALEKRINRLRGLEEEQRNEGLRRSKSPHQKMIAGKPDGQRQRKITIANEVANLLGNRGLSISEYSSRMRTRAKLDPDHAKNFDMSKGEQIDMKTSRDALAYIKYGISNLKSGDDRKASDNFYKAKKVLSSAGYRGKAFKQNFPELDKKLTSLITLIKTRDSRFGMKRDTLDDKQRLNIASNQLTKAILSLNSIGEIELQYRVMGVQQKMSKMPISRVRERLEMLMKLVRKAISPSDTRDILREFENSLVALRNARDILPK